MRFQPTSSQAIDCESAVNPTNRHAKAGFTLAEVAISIALTAIFFYAIVTGYTLAGTREEWSGYSLAAQTLSLQVLEQTRSAVWDGVNTTSVATNAIKNEVMALATNAVNAVAYTMQYPTNMTVTMTNLLDVPWRGTNFVIATNYVSVKMVNYTGNTNVLMYFIRVDTVWPFVAWVNHNARYYTNTACTYMAPDNLTPSDLGVSNPNF